MQRCGGAQTQFLVFTKFLSPADLAEYADENKYKYLCVLCALRAKQ